MLKDFLLFIKYPYTAGIIAVIWLGSVLMVALADDLNLLEVIVVDLVATLLIALIGFSDKKIL